jgi:hypothetical protein
VVQREPRQKVFIALTPAVNVMYFFVTDASTNELKCCSGLQSRLYSNLDRKSCAYQSATT